MKKKEKEKKFALVILLLMITVGYALLSTNVKLKGTSKIKDARWDIHLENIKVKEKSVRAEKEARIDDTKLGVEYEVNLDTPGDFYEFNVDIVNDGTIDGMIDSVESKMKINEEEEIDLLKEKTPNYLIYSVNYTTGGSIEEKQELKKGEKKTIKVHLEYNKNIIPEDLPIEEKNIEFTFSINYVQKDDSAVQVEELALGKYVEITPTSTSYTINKEDTGNITSQTINPSELNLWRIIKINEDGTMDAISEYTSSKIISFKGKKGYQNFVKTINQIASQYENKNYTTSSRMIGYDRQKEILENFDASNIPSTLETTKQITEGEGEEFYNGLGGDNLYIKDYLLVSNVYKDQNNSHGENGLIAFSVNRRTTPTSYYLSSRIFHKIDQSNYDFRLLTISNTGKLQDNIPLLSFNANETEIQQANSIRPIITLKNDLQINSGKGVLNNPYKLK